MLQMTAAVAKHTRTRVTRRRVLMARKQTVLARKMLSRFLQLTGDREDLLTAAARNLVRNSYYYTDNLQEWTEHLKKFYVQLRKRSSGTGCRLNGPDVLLMGSPVYFPNYKVPFLIQESGLNIPCVVDETELKLRNVSAFQSQEGGCRRLICAIAKEKYITDASAAFVNNDALFRYTEKLLQHRRIDGVVFHVLKGQIEYDFELERFEGLFSSCGIPVFRLETDYQYQDVEQLRIRMEAFSEMLTQKRYREEKIAL